MSVGRLDKRPQPSRAGTVSSWAKRNPPFRARVTAAIKSLIRSILGMSKIAHPPVPVGMHIRGMTANPESLTPAELLSLIEVANCPPHLPRPQIPVPHSVRLIQFGYIQYFDGRLRMTTPGRRIAEIQNRPAQLNLLGREIITVDLQSGEVHLGFFAAPQFANHHGTVQGGMLAAMLDSATGNAVMANLPHNQTAVTTRLDTTFVKPAALGALTAKARLVKQDERSVIAEAELLDSSGQIVARACAELRVQELR